MLRALDHLEEWIIATLIGSATLLIFVAVLHRYSLDLSADFQWDAAYDWLFEFDLSWAQELCIYMFVWMAKFGAAYGVRTGIHVGVDVLINNLSERLRSKFVLLGLMGGVIFTGLVGTFGANFVWHIAHTETTSPDLEIPVWIVYLAIPFGSYLMCFRFLQVAWSFSRTGELPRHDQSRVEGIDEQIEWAHAHGAPESVMIGESVQVTEEREHIHHRRPTGRGPGGPHHPANGRNGSPGGHGRNGDGGKGGQ